MSVPHKNKKIFSIYNLFLTALVIGLFSTLFFALPGCNEEPVFGSNSATNDNVSVGFYSENASGDNSLVITEAKFLLRKIMLRPETQTGAVLINPEPRVISLDLTQKVVTAAIGSVPVGNYTEIIFHIAKPSASETVRDREFYEGPGENQRFSVIAKGTYNNKPFVFKSGVSVGREIGLENPPIATTVNTRINITVRLNPNSWFMNENLLLDPTDENNNHMINENIINSLRRAYLDVDLNGQPD